ncbi:MAG: hypothetical protein LC114_24620, partial [Bryobacterales bacterium]|nr:hypothetical protein [Bryobacterales bacterium]
MSTRSARPNILTVYGATASFAMLTLLCVMSARAEDRKERGPLPSYLAPLPSGALSAASDAAEAMLPGTPAPAATASGRISRSVPPGSPVVPLTLEQKSRLLLLSTFQPEALARMGFSAALATLRDSPGEWPQTAETYNWRFASRVGERLVAKSTEALVGSALLHEDPRYFLAEQPGVGARLRNALKQTWMTRKDDGSWAPAWGAFAGAYSAGLVSA